ncbi:MAG: PH domain-containing protein [Candidatus Micrarchaeota archaeon]|nr:PH domain-containing protein [Candidatus Micrarchaeota archaeon]
MDSSEKHVDSKVKLVWFAPTAIAIVFIWLAASLFYAVLMPDGSIAGLSDLAFAVLFLLAILLLAGLPVYLWLELTYRNLTYQLTEREIVIREGVLARKTTVIPYDKIQDISSTRSLFERLVGLATLEIETAGSSRTASETLLPGIANKDEFISEVMRRVESTKPKEGASQKEHQPSPSEALLSEILKELKTISLKLDSLSKESQKRPALKPERTGASIFEEYGQFKKR